jgi:hypothetical protein
MGADPVLPPRLRLDGVEADVKRIAGTVLVVAVCSLFYGLLFIAGWVFMAWIWRQI